MKKEKFELTELEIIRFQSQDVLVISNYEDDELPINQNQP